MKFKKLATAVLAGTMFFSTIGTASAQTATIDLGSSVATLDGAQVMLSNTAGVNERGEVLVPVRAIAELFGGTVHYYADKNLITLNFPNGNWATINVLDMIQDSADSTPVTDAYGNIISIGTFKDDHLYIPASLMATCLGGKVEAISYGQDSVYRLIYHVR